MLYQCKCHCHYMIYSVPIIYRIHKLVDFIGFRPVWPPLFWGVDPRFSKGSVSLSNLSKRNQRFFNPKKIGIIFQKKPSCNSHIFRSFPNRTSISTTFVWLHVWMRSSSEAEKRRSKMAEDGDLSELFEALEMEDDGKAEFRILGSGDLRGVAWMWSVGSQVSSSADDEWIIIIVMIAILYWCI